MSFFYLIIVVTKPIKNRGTSMNFKSMFLGLFALILGLWMSGCSSATGYVISQGIQMGAHVTDFAINAIDNTIDEQSDVTEVVIVGYSEKQLDSNSSYEKLFNNDNFTIYSKNNSEGYLYLLDKRNDNNITLIETSGRQIALKKFKDIDFSLLVNGGKMPLRFDMTKFKSHMEKDKFGNLVWAGNDLVLEMNYSPLRQDEVYYIPNARNIYADSNDTNKTIMLTFAEIMDASINRTYETELYFSETAHTDITEELLDNNSSYQKIYESKNLSLYRKAGADKNAMFVLDKRNPKNVVLIETSRGNIIDRYKDSSRHGREWFPVKVCIMGDDIDEKILETQVESKDKFGNTTWYWNGIILEHKVKTAGFTLEKHHTYTYIPTDGRYTGKEGESCSQALKLAKEKD